MERKKKVLIHTNSHSALTGFGKNCKNIIRYLHQTGKYELIEFANGVVWGVGENSFPWKMYGSLPNDPATLNSLNSSPELAKRASYGLLTIDEVIKKTEPDIYIGIEDIWAFPEIVAKPWWNKINGVIWTTLDSLPILPDAIALAPRIKNYYCWSKFAETALKKIGVQHIKTMHGSIDERNFFRKNDQDRLALRKRFNISPQSFIVGFVFRNQLRKTVGDLITAAAIVKKNYPEIDLKLLLHTNWAEGWDIARLCQDNGYPLANILTTYVCSSCRNYHVMNFSGHNLRCPYCGKDKTFTTTNVVSGASEEQLNEIYNLMDLYAHPFTSGGQEIPIQEAKLTELITLVTNYTCGEEMCTPESGGIPLAWTPYREIGTQFIKASTNPVDLAQKILHVCSLPLQTRKEMGQVARKYVIENYSFHSIGKKIEELIDSLPTVDFKYANIAPKRNPNFEPNPTYDSDVEFIKDLYRNFLAAEVANNDQGLTHWVQKLRQGENPVGIKNYFKSVCEKELAQEDQSSIEKIIDKNDPSPRLAFVVPSDSLIALLCSYFIEPIKCAYPNHKLYVFAEKQLHSIFRPYMASIHKLLPKLANCENINHMEGLGNHEGFFDVCLMLNKEWLNSSTFTHNNQDIVPSKDIFLTGKALPCT